MLRFLFTGIVLIVFPTVALGEIAEIVLSAVKVRAATDLNSEVIGYLKKGDIVTVLENQAGAKWVAVDLRGRRGILQKWTVRLSEGDKKETEAVTNIKEIAPSSLPVVVARISEMPVRLVPEKSQAAAHATDLLLLEAMRTAPEYSLGNGERVRAVRAGDLIAFFGAKSHGKAIRSYLSRAVIRGISTDAGILLIADFHRLRWLPQ